MLRQAFQGKNVLIYLVLFLLCALFLPSSSMSHKPLFAQSGISGFETAQTIPDADTAYGMVGELKAPQQVDVFKLGVTADTNFYARISVPNKPETKTFTPAFLLLGPGLPTTNLPPNFPLEFDQDMGRAILLAKGEKDESFEPFTQVSLLQRQYVSHTLHPGTYYLAVYDPDGRTGKYLLSTGTKKGFSLLDWLSFPVTWYKVRMWYDPTQTMLLLLGLAAGIGTLAYYVKAKNRP